MTPRKQLLVTATAVTVAGVGLTVADNIMPAPLVHAAWAAWGIVVGATWTLALGLRSKES